MESIMTMNKFIKLSDEDLSRIEGGVSYSPFLRGLAAVANHPAVSIAIAAVGAYEFGKIVGRWWYDITH